MQASQRTNAIQPSVFAWLNTLKERVRANGTQLIDLGIGSPDRPAPGIITEAIATASRDPISHGYPAYRGTPQFLDAAAAFMERRFAVQLDPSSELMCVSGAEEGFTHLGLTFLEPGTQSLICDIHYPVHARSALIAGAQATLMPVDVQNGFVPVLADIDSRTLRNARMLIINYPHNPTGAIAPMSFYEDAVELCRKHELLLVSDLAYSEMTFDGYTAPSALQVPGAKDVTIELHSLSKSFNMAGFRIAFAAGSATAMDALYRIRSNAGYGSPTAIQAGGVVALDNAERLIPEVIEPYSARRDTLVAALREIGCPVHNPSATMFLWLPVPNGFTSQDWVRHLMEATGVVVTPGNAFGPGGEGWFRVSLVASPDILQHAAGLIGSLAPVWRAAASQPA